MDKNTCKNKHLFLSTAIHACDKTSASNKRGHKCCRGMLNCVGNYVVFGTLHCLFHKSCKVSVSVFEAACPGALVPPYIDWLSPAVCFRSPLSPLQFLPASLCYLQRLSTLTVTPTVKQLVKRTLLIKNTSVCLSVCLSVTH